MISVFFLLQNTPEGSVLLGAISYGKLSFGVQNEERNPTKNPVSYLVSYNVPPNKVTTVCKIVDSLYKVCFSGSLISYFLFQIFQCVFSSN